MVFQWRGIRPENGISIDKLKNPDPKAGLIYVLNLTEKSASRFEKGDRPIAVTLIREGRALRSTKRAPLKLKGKLQLQSLFSLAEKGDVLLIELYEHLDIPGIPINVIIGIKEG